MFREIRTTERITDTMVRTSVNNNVMRILDRRITPNTKRELEEARGERKESRFNPDKRI